MTEENVQTQDPDQVTLVEPPADPAALVPLGRDLLVRRATKPEKSEEPGLRLSEGFVMGYRHHDGPTGSRRSGGRGTTSDSGAATPSRHSSTTTPHGDRT